MASFVSYVFYTVFFFFILEFVALGLIVLRKLSPSTMLVVKGIECTEILPPRRDTEAFFLVYPQLKYIPKYTKKKKKTMKIA